MNDSVNSPSNYVSGGIECIDAMRAVMGFNTVGITPYEGYLWGNVVKYIWRWPNKNGLEDLRKCRWYLDRLIEEIGGENG